VATGGSFFDMTAGDSVFAFALPGGLPAPKAMPNATNDIATPASQPQNAQTTASVAPSAQMPEGEGKAIVQKQCAVCHAITVVTAKRASHSEWEQVVNQMVSRGADLSDDDIDTVLEYLTKNYGPLDQMTPPPAGANAPHQ
jgi:mono/diheme cytochrome c family protein